MQFPMQQQGHSLPPPQFPMFHAPQMQQPMQFLPQQHMQLPPPSMLLKPMHFPMQQHAQLSQPFQFPGPQPHQQPNQHLHQQSQLSPPSQFLPQQHMQPRQLSPMTMQPQPQYPQVSPLSTQHQSIPQPHGQQLSPMQMPGWQTVHSSSHLHQQGAQQTQQSLQQSSQLPSWMTQLSSAQVHQQVVQQSQQSLQQTTQLPSWQAPQSSVHVTQQVSQQTQPSSQQNTPQTQPQAQQGAVMPQVTTPPRIKFRIDAEGKIRYETREDATARQQHANAYMSMDPKDFATFKNAGKRYGSNKLTDVATMQSYVHHGGQYYKFDKTKDGNRGDLVQDQGAITKLHTSGGLLDRSRTDRTTQNLAPFDVGHYQSKPVGSKMDVMSTKSENFGANRDHVTSGESLRQRGGDIAYKQGLTIAIPNNEMHMPHSATYGGRQGSKDKVGGVEKKRVEHDALHPTLAFHRDADTMLSRTKNGNYGHVHASLDLTKPDNRVKQVGAYRTLYRGNVKMFKADNTRGVDPGVQAHDFVHTPKPNGKIGKFSSTQTTGNVSQGTKIASNLSTHLKDTGKAN